MRLEEAAGLQSGAHSEHKVGGCWEASEPPGPERSRGAPRKETQGQEEREEAKKKEASDFTLCTHVCVYFTLRACAHVCVLLYARVHACIYLCISIYLHKFEFKD